MRSGVGSSVKESCTGFGEKGYFSYFRVVGAWVDHGVQAVGLRIVGFGIGKFGVS